MNFYWYLLISNRTSMTQVISCVGLCHELVRCLRHKDSISSFTDFSGKLLLLPRSWDLVSFFAFPPTYTLFSHSLHCTALPVLRVYCEKFILGPDAFVAFGHCPLSFIVWISKSLETLDILKMPELKNSKFHTHLIYVKLHNVRRCQVTRLHWIWCADTGLDMQIVD